MALRQASVADRRATSSIVLLMPGDSSVFARIASVEGRPHRRHGHPRGKLCPLRPQDRFREPRELARVARSRRAARAGIRRGRAPRLSRVRAPLLRLRPRGLHDVPHGIRRGILLQGPRRLSVLQRQAHGTDGGASRRSRHPAGARAAVGDLRAEAIAGHAGRPTPSRRGAHEDLPDRDRTAPARGVRRAL